MKTVYSFLVVAAVGGLLFFSTRPHAVSQDAKQQPVKWEYYVLERPYNDMQQKLDNLGKNGWELVAVIPAIDKSPETYFFKKPMLW